MSALYNAACEGDIDKVRELLAECNDVNAPLNSLRWTALHAAASGGHVHVVQLLLDSGADVNVLGSNDKSVWHLAAATGRAAVVQLLLQKGADINEVCTGCRWTALHFAAKNGHHATVQCLLQHQCQVNIRARDGCTALMLAARNGRLECVKELLKYSADLETRGPEGLTPEQMADKKGHHGIAAILRKHKAERDKKDKEDNNIVLTYKRVDSPDKEISPNSQHQKKVYHHFGHIYVKPKHPQGAKIISKQISVTPKQPQQPASSVLSGQPVVKEQGFGLPYNSTITQRDCHFIWNQLAPNVCQIIFPGGVGTGFVLGSLKTGLFETSHRFILTCNHLQVHTCFSDSKPVWAKFGFGDQSGSFDVVIKPHVFARDDMLDYVLLCLEPSDQLELYLSQANNLWELLTVNQPDVNDPLIIVGHHGGNEKTLDPTVYVVQRSKVRSDLQSVQTGAGLESIHNNSFIHYQSHSFHGSSGSPCFSIPKQHLYAMHCGGLFSGPASHAGVMSAYEKGVLLRDVLLDIEMKLSQAQASGQLRPSPYINVEDLYKIVPSMQKLKQAGSGLQAASHF